MQMLNQRKVNNSRIKKSHILIIGSLLVFFGVGVLSWNRLLVLKQEVYSDMMIMISDSLSQYEEIIENIPETENLPSDTPVNEESSVDVPIENVPVQTPVVTPKPTINYDKYLGVLEIPRIGLKRGFYGIDSKYNDIQYNVTMVTGSKLPDVDKGNLILMAHSGDAYISFFAYLYKLDFGDSIYVTYNKVKYHYKLVNYYNVDKDGTVSIIRNYDKTTLTLITCTKDDSTRQTVYIAELV